MANAIKEGSTDGIGLARPIAAEPDLPKKILDGTASGSVADRLDQNNFGLTLMASIAQMALMGKRSLKEANGEVCKDIPDFSREAEAESFQKYVTAFTAELMKAAAENTVISAVPEYVTVFDY